MNVKNKLDIIVSGDTSNKNLFDTFLSESFDLNGLKENYCLVFNELTNDQHPDYGYLSNRYINARILQIKNIIKYIENNIGAKEYAISCDTDIVFLSNFDKEIANHLNSNYTIYFMSENQHEDLPNCGFIIFKICQDSLFFFKELYNIFSSDSLELIKNLPKTCLSILLSHNIKYKILDLKFANNNYPHHAFKKYIKDKTLACFHATSTYNIYEKITVLSKFYKNHKHYTSTFIVDYHHHDWLVLLSQNNTNEIISYEDIIKKKTNLTSVYFYIKYIIQNYHRLSQYTFCLSNNLLSDNNFFEYLIPENRLNELCDICNIRGGIMCLGNSRTQTDELIFQEKSYKLSLRYFLDSLFEEDNASYTNELELVESDCYIIRNVNILNRPKYFYEHLLKFIDLNPTVNSQIVNKLMIYIFDIKLSLKNE